VETQLKNNQRAQRVDSQAEGHFLRDPYDWVYSSDLARRDHVASPVQKSGLLGGAVPKEFLSEC
jgi:hypothetical protein